jgi:hypothetical protein
MESKINHLSMNGKNEGIGDLYRRIKEFKRGCQPRSTLMKDENSDLLADSHNVFNRGKNFPQILKVHSVSDVGTEIRTSAPLVPGPSRLEVEGAIV